MVNSTYGKGRQVTDDDSKIVDGGDQSKKLRWEISGIASGTTVTMTAPTSDFNFNTISNLPVVDTTAIVKGSADDTKKVRIEADGVATGVTRVITMPDADVDLTDMVTDASTETFTNKTIDANGTGNSITNIDVADLSNGTDGELITWDANAAPAVVAVGNSGEVLTSGGVGVAPTFQAATGGLSNIVEDTTPQLGGDLDLNSKNITSAAALDISIGADFTLTQNSVIPFTSVESGAVVNTLYLKAGDVGFGIAPSGKLHIAKSNASSFLYHDVYDDNDVSSPQFYFRKSNSDTIGTVAETGNGDRIGNIVFQGVNSSGAFENGIVIKATQHAASGVSVVPVTLSIKTYSSSASFADTLVLKEGKTGVGGTSDPGQVFDVNAGTGNMIVDGYDTHPSFFEKKVNPVIISFAGYADKVKNTPVYKFKKNPFVSADELKKLAITEFGKTKWDAIFPTENAHRQKALYNMADGGIKTFIDNEADRLRIERSTEHKNKREYCSIVLDDAGTESNFQEVLIKDEANVVTGFNIESYIGVLHLAIQELKQEVDNLKLSVFSA